MGIEINEINKNADYNGDIVDSIYPMYLYYTRTPMYLYSYTYTSILYMRRYPNQ